MPEGALGGPAVLLFCLASALGDWQAYPRPHLLVTGMRGYTESGVIGRPSLATAEKGRTILDSLARSFKDHLELLL